MRAQEMRTKDKDFHVGGGRSFFSVVGGESRLSEDKIDARSDAIRLLFVFFFVIFFLKFFEFVLLMSTSPFVWKQYMSIK